jgi:hypothetical protein
MNLQSYRQGLPYMKRAEEVRKKDSLQPVLRDSHRHKQRNLDVCAFKRQQLMDENLLDGTSRLYLDDDD